MKDFERDYVDSVRSNLISSINWARRLTNGLIQNGVVTSEEIDELEEEHRASKKCIGRLIDILKYRKNGYQVLRDTLHSCLQSDAVSILDQIPTEDVVSKPKAIPSMDQESTHVTVKVKVDLKAPLQSMAPDVNRMITKTMDGTTTYSDAEPKLKKPKLENELIRSLPIRTLLTNGLELKEGDYIIARVVWRPDMSHLKEKRRFICILRDQTGCMEAFLRQGTRPSTNATNVEHKLQKHSIFKIKNFEVEDLDSRYVPRIAGQRKQLKLSYSLTDYEPMASCEIPRHMPFSLTDIENISLGTKTLVGYVGQIEDLKTKEEKDFQSVRLLARRTCDQKKAVAIDLYAFDRYVRHFKKKQTYAISNLKVITTIDGTKKLATTSATIPIKISKNTIDVLSTELLNIEFVKTLLVESWMDGDGTTNSENEKRKNQRPSTGPSILQAEQAAPTPASAVTPAPVTNARNSTCSPSAEPSQAAGSFPDVVSPLDPQPLSKQSVVPTPATEKHSSSQVEATSSDENSLSLKPQFKGPPHRLAIKESLFPTQ